MMARLRTRRLSLATLVALAVVFLLARFGGELRDLLRPRPAGGAEGFEVVRVIDGDTIVVAPNPFLQSASGDHIRLLGVDTPESVHPSKPVERFGLEAAAFTRRLCEGRRVRLEFEPGNTQDRGARPERSRGRRTVAYVFLEDGTLVNAEIIRQGYGYAYTRFPFARMEEFRALEAEARAARRGLWAEE